MKAPFRGLANLPKMTSDPTVTSKASAVTRPGIWAAPGWSRALCEGVTLQGGLGRASTGCRTQDAAFPGERAHAPPSPRVCTGPSEGRGGPVVSSRLNFRCWSEINPCSRGSPRKFLDVSCLWRLVKL